jgi:hypothetical protein
MSRRLRRLVSAMERAERRGREGARPRWSLEAFADGHAPQLAAMRDRSNWLHFMCDRQSGKTWADLGILLDNALAHRNGVNVFLGLVSTGLTLSVWPKWQALLDRFAIKRRDRNDEKITTFPNGAIVAFGGTDDLVNVKKYLGNRLHNSVFIVDECQDQKSSVLKYLLDVLLEPMCTPTTRVILSGVLPDLPVGHFLALAEPDEASKTGGSKGYQKWSHHSWGRLANVHTPEAAQRLALLEAQKGADDPQLLRDWKGVQRVWDTSFTAYRYSAARNAWSWTSPQWARAEMLQPGRLLAALPIVPHPTEKRFVTLDRFAIGLDPAATADRFAIVMWGWSSKERVGLWQVAEWVTERGANALESQYLEVLKVLKAQYAPYGNIVRIIRDAGSSRTTNDMLRRSHGIVIEPAIKGPGSLRARVDKLADLLGTGQGHVMAGSELENDLKLAKWDIKAREDGRWDFDGSHHPDVADAGTYGAVPFYEAHDKTAAQEPTATDQERLDAAKAKRIERIKKRQGGDWWEGDGREMGFE